MLQKQESDIIKQNYIGRRVVTSILKSVKLSFEDICDAVKPIAEKYFISEVYLFGSYARGEADETSDVDLFVIGGASFKLTNIFAFAEELRIALHKEVDAFELHEINQGSDFYKSIMEEMVRVA